MAKATIRGSVFITDLRDGERAALKKALTIPNPKHAAAVKYGKRGYTALPPTLCYCSEFESGGRRWVQAPAGFDFDGAGIRFDEINDMRTVREVRYPLFRLKLRAAQSEAFRAYDAANDCEAGRSAPRGLVQMPTGLGKSVLGLYVAAMFRQRALVLVHKNDLLDGWRQDIAQCFGGETEAGIIQGKTLRIGEHITLAMVQTLSRWGEAELGALSDEFGLVIVDEAHHAPAASYSLIESFSAYYRLGLSATPERADGLTAVMEFYFGGFAYRHRRDGADADILPVEVVLRQSTFIFEPCLNTRTGAVENMYIENGDGAQTLRNEPGLVPFCDIPRGSRPALRHHAIEKEALGSDVYMREVCTDILAEYRMGANCIAFFGQKSLLERFREHLAGYVGAGNVQTFHGDGDVSDEVVKGRAESGEVRITLATYAKGTEGTNVRAWDTAFLVSSVNSGKNVEQAVGRIRRTKQGKRKAAKVYDYRHPRVCGWKHHGATRDARYAKLKFSGGKIGGRYSRGYGARSF